ncbi:MAG: Hsp20/alpha crystallin family protein [Thermoanaerobaculia bacterium]
MRGRFHAAALISSLQQELNGMLNKALQLSEHPASGNWQPRVDVIESATSLTLLADAPGVDPADLSVETAGDLVTIRGTKPTPADPPQGARFHRVERRHGPFERQILIQQAIDSRRGKARLIDGLLRIEFPKIVNQRRRPYHIESEIPDGTEGADQVG